MLHTKFHENRSAGSGEEDFLVVFTIYEGLDGGSWYSLITKNLAIYSLSLKFWLIH